MLIIKVKNNQQREDHLGPWHVYPNQHEPRIWPYIVLALYLFTFPKGMKSVHHSLRGKVNMKYTLFHNVLEEYEDEFYMLVSKKDIL